MSAMFCVFCIFVDVQVVFHSQKSWQEFAALFHEGLFLLNYLDVLFLMLCTRFYCDNEVRNLILLNWLIHCVRFVEYVLFFCFILVFVTIV